MYRNVVSAMKEAQDITTHLKPLASHFEVDDLLSTSMLHLWPQALETTDWPEVRPLFPPLMHVVCLVYSHRFYPFVAFLFTY